MADFADLVTDADRAEAQRVLGFYGLSGAPPQMTLGELRQFKEELARSLAVVRLAGFRLEPAPIEATVIGYAGACPKRPGVKCETPLSCSGGCRYADDPIHPNRTGA